MGGWRGRAPGPTPGGAALRSAALPGWGQWACGRRRRGAVLAGLTLALAGPVVVLAALLVLLLGAALLPPLPLLAHLASRTPLPAALGHLVLGGGSPEPTPGGRAWGNALGPLAAGAGGWAMALAVRAGWAGVGTMALATNLLVGVLRGWVVVDAARCTRRTARQTALRALAPPGWRRWPRRAAGPAAALCAALLVLAPHAALAATGYAGGARLARTFRVGRAGPAPPGPTASGTGALAALTGPASDAVSDDASAPLLPAATLTDARPAGTWDGTGRLNVLLLGSDRRPDEAAAGAWGNSDTLLLLSVDPGLGGAALISVPRDLYLQVPGVGWEKINAAYRVGGPALAQRVVGDLLGVPIHSWAAVDVPALARVVDAVGGVVVDVERPLRDDEYPNEDYSVRRVLLPAGLQWLDGERALWYARSRHGSNDFDRAERQQRLLLALRARLTDPQVLPRLPVLLDVVGGAVQTDLAPRELLALARLATSPAARAAGVRRLVLTPPVYGREVVRPELYAITPDRARIRRAVAALLAGAAAPDAAERPSALPT